MDDKKSDATPKRQGSKEIVLAKERLSKDLEIQKSISSKDQHSNSAQVIHQLTSLVLSDGSNSFIENQRLINEQSLRLHQHHHLTNSELQNRIQFLSRLIQIGAQYVKKVQESVVSLRRDHAVVSERLNDQVHKIQAMEDNIHHMKNDLKNDLDRIEKLEHLNKNSVLFKYAIYIMTAYLFLRRKYKSLGAIAALYSMLSQKEVVLEMIKTNLLKLF